MSPALPESPAYNRITQFERLAKNFDDELARQLTWRVWQFELLTSSRMEDVAAAVARWTRTLRHAGQSDRWTPGC